MSAEGIINAFEELIKAIPPHVTLVAVSKTKPKEDIISLYNSGQRDFGENKVQELVEKSNELPEDIKWHFIGHLQTNKVKYIVDFVYLIHSVDSFKLLTEINKRSAQKNRIASCLLQVYIATEESKFGFDQSELTKLHESKEFLALKNIKITGLMGMATNTSNTKKISEEFKRLSSIFEELKNTFYNDDPNFKNLSMGMTSDYEIAISEGSNMIRVGSLIFGERNK